MFNLCFCLAVLAFIFSYILYVYCYSPTYQVKLLVCENQLGNNTDSDFEPDIAEGAVIITNSSHNI